MSSISSVPPTSKSEPTQNAVHHLIAGIFGGFTSTVALYPLELIKTRMQVAGRYGDGEYGSLYSSLRTVIHREGARGLYQGVVPAILGSCGAWGGYFYFYELSKKRLLSSQNRHGTELGVADHLRAATEAGVFLVFVFNPIWLTKTRLALQAVSPSHRPYTGFIDCMRVIVREEGVQGLYRGIVPALLLTSLGALQFASYEIMKGWTEGFFGKTEQPAWVAGANGAVAKIIASTITYPYQVIKSRLQQRDLPAATQPAVTIETTVKTVKDPVATTTPAAKNIFPSSPGTSATTSIGPSVNIVRESTAQPAAAKAAVTASRPVGGTISSGITINTAAAPAVSSSSSGASSSSVSSSSATAAVSSSGSTSAGAAATNSKNYVLGNLRYTGTIDCVLKTYRKDGAWAFYRGAVPNALKVAPSAALTFLVYEETLKWLKTHSLYS